MGGFGVTPTGLCVRSSLQLLVVVLGGTAGRGSWVTVRTKGSFERTRQTEIEILATIDWEVLIETSQSSQCPDFVTMIGTRTGMGARPGLRDNNPNPVE